MSRIIRRLTAAALVLTVLGAVLVVLGLDQERDQPSANTAAWWTGNTWGGGSFTFDTYREAWQDPDISLDDGYRSGLSVVEVPVNADVGLVRYWPEDTRNGFELVMPEIGLALIALSVLCWILLLMLRARRFESR
ncbi:hypothetical protein D1871_16265 [Nakamurella silvestris]|nr:hypothetical protein D1871_16265 [Nakamurella silvestris]